LAFLRNAANFKGIRAKGIISVIVIASVSYSLFFYLQYATENNIRNNLFAQQEQRQIDSTKAISEHVKSDFDSIISRLQGLANSIYMQQGDLSGDKTNELMKEIFLPQSTSFGVDRIAILNENGTLVNSLAIKGERIYTGTNFSFRSWVRQTKNTLAPVFPGGFQGVDGKVRVALTYPIVNRETGKYLGLVAASVPTVEFFQRYGNI
jgi:HK/GC/Chemotaxis protein-like, sensor domain